MAKKKKTEKTPRSQGWDFLRVIRKIQKKILKPENAGIVRYTLLGLAGICVLIAVFVIYCLAYGNKSYPKITVAGVKVGGMKSSEVKKTLDQAFNKTESKEIKFNYQDKNWILPLGDIKLTYNESKTQDQVMLVGREKSFPVKIGSRLKAIFKTKEIEPIYAYDEKALTDFVGKIANDVDIPEKDATGVIKGNNVSFVQERNGTRVNQAKLIKQIKSEIAKMNPKKIEVTVAVAYPNVTLGDTEAARQQVLTMLKSRLNLKWQKGNWNVSPDTFTGWIKFKSEEIKGDAGGYRLVAYLSDDEIGDYLKKISKDIDGAPKNAKLAMVDNKLTVTSPSVTGYAFDQSASIAPIKEAITAGQSKEIQLSVKEVQPDVTDSNFTSLGINEIIGTGATNFKGSTDARKANIANGTRIVTGTLIKPGDEFSAVKAIGNVDASTGFVIGLVIKGNKTQPEYGGGLCQVSSTLFRAALYSGLRVTERKNHAYRVSYYETDGNGKKIGPGLDSTIYGPHPDLRFVNDTGHWILVQGRVEGNKLTFDFWGTKDGRVATIDGPHVSNEIPAPATQYIETDTLYVGQKQQLEGSHPGATAVVNYTVTRNGQVINQQTFKSVFKPWGGQILVGTKPVETPAPAPAAPVETPVVTPPATDTTTQTTTPAQ